MSFIQECLIKLKNDHSLVALKAGTEIEDMSFAEIALMRNISWNILPIYLKISGPNARNDIRVAKYLQLNGLIAPHIHNTYMFKQFQTAVQTLCSHFHFDLIAINIDSIEAYRNLDKLFLLPDLSNIDLINIHLSNITQSYNHNNNFMELECFIKDLLARIKSYGIKTSLEGYINPDNAYILKNTFNPNFLLTRHCIINCKEATQISKTINHVLSFEILLFKELMKIEPEKKKEYEKRIEILIKTYSL